MNLEKKQKKIETICGDWSYRNIDMTEPHLQSIEIINNDILISCELFSPDIDDYFSCDGGMISDKNLIKKFKKLDLKKKTDVLEFIADIENQINWDKVNKKLYNEVLKEKENLEYVECEDLETDIVPCSKLGDGWFWHKYNDGSGHLESPDGKEYMSYDLQTNEYKTTSESSYDFFPLNYYYIDGVDSSEFDPFDYMEQEMIDYILPKEKEEVCL